MSLAIVQSRAKIGLTAPPVTIEVHLSGGLPALHMVGLPETAVKESKDRVRSAILTSRFEFPSQRITVNLAPADLPKEGGRFDLPIALGILAASGQIPRHLLNDYEFAGELALSGELRPVPGLLPFSIAASNAEKTLIVPMQNCAEAALPSQARIMGARHLLDVSRHFLSEKKLQLYERDEFIEPILTSLDLADVYGQTQARRALEIAAAGQHSLLMVGPPGTGKTMLASRLPSILPEMSEEEALELAAVHSISGKDVQLALWRQRAFRAPHHTASSVALVGGGSPPRPGEISLAHLGVLFLDELPEFKRSVLEAMREPMESGHVIISRAAFQTQFPARFQLIAAMNPCPCGYLGDFETPCECSSALIQRYQTRISGPILDRIDLHIHVPRLPKGALLKNANTEAENSEKVRVRVLAARAIQMRRNHHKPNSALSNREMKELCHLGNKESELLENAGDKLGLSARAYHRIIRISRTIADLDNAENICTDHLSEALVYRGLFNKKN